MSQGFSGFQFQKKNPYKKEDGVDSMSYPTAIGRGSSSSRGSSGYTMKIGKRRIKEDEEFFEEEEQLEYQPAPDSPTGKEDDVGNQSDASDDPLDAFMAGIEKEVSDQKAGLNPSKKTDDKGVRDDIEQEDEMEAYLRYMEENPNAGRLGDDDEEYEYDEEGNIIVPVGPKVIDPLPAIDHSEIEYKPFNKNFYEEHEEIKALTYDKISALRNDLGIKVSGLIPPKPVCSFAHFGFDDSLHKAIIKAGFTQPTPIQSQGIPVSLSGRDIIGIAKTGSGKTAAYLWPLLVHIMDQPRLKEGEGPVGLILAPTRELAQQIFVECRKFGKVFDIRSVCAYGGGNMYEQTNACAEWPEIIVCTPGRLIDLVKKKATSLSRVTYLVLDEADRMFDMGFEPQVRSIADHVRPDRQTSLFSATFKKKVEKLARDVLRDPVRVVQGDIGEANEDVTQIVKVLPVGAAKWTWLLGRLIEFTSLGSLLIFVTKKANSIELANNMKLKEHTVLLIHGDMSQGERNEVITKFKKKEVPILVATDVAARGLDIPHLRTVVNYDPARDIDTHTHRIGRTGRAGQKGTAFTLVTAKDKEFCGHLVRNLEGANQNVPQELLDLAMQTSWFKNSRFKKTLAKKLGGLGFREKERPGLGAGGSSSTMNSATSFSSYKPGVGAGPQSDRLTVMKSAFKAQFKSNFVTSSEEWTGSVNKVEFTDPRVNPTSEPYKRRKKSRFSD